MSTSTRQFKRVAQLITGTNGTGLLAEGFRITFKIVKTIGRTPNTAEINVYNLSPSSEALVKGEFDEVLLNAGYDGSAILLFRGNIRHSNGRNEGPERILQLDCASGDRDFQNSMVNVSLAAGTTDAQLIDQHIIPSFTTTTKGTVVIKDRKRGRGRVISAMTRDILDKIAAENDAHWSIQDGAMHIIPSDTTLPNEAIVITSETGMLSTPQITDKGISVRCLLNPRILPAGKIWLDNNNFKATVRQAKLKLPGAKAHTGAKAKQKHSQARQDPDGIYKVLRVEHEGDTRGDKWESTVTCVALGNPIPAGRAAA